jgi:hypothetical protein
MKIESALADGDVARREHSGGHSDGPNWPTLIISVCLTHGLRAGIVLCIVLGGCHAVSVSATRP